MFDSFVMAFLCDYVHQPKNMHAIGSTPGSLPSLVCVLCMPRERFSFMWFTKIIYYFAHLRIIFGRLFWAAIRHWNREWDSIIIQCDEISLFEVNGAYGSFLNTAPYLNRNPFHSTSPFWYDICGYYLGKRNALKNTKFSSKHVHTHTHTIIIKI